MAGLGAALAWSGGSLAIKPISTRFSAFSLNGLRSLAGWVFLLAILVPMGKVTAVSEIPWSGLWYVILSGIVGVVIGTTLYIKSISLMDINKTYPIAYGCWLLSTAIIAAIFLNEDVTAFTVTGAVLVITGIVILVTRTTGSAKKASGTSGKGAPVGAICSILAGLGWAAGGVFLKLGVSLVNPLMVNVVRIPAIVIFLFILALGQGGTLEFKKYGCRSLFLVSVAGILDQGIGAVLYFVSIQLAGVAKATILSSTAPLFVAPLSVVLLKEKLTGWTVLGTLLCVFGIWLTVIK